MIVVVSCVVVLENALRFLPRPGHGRRAQQDHDEWSRGGLEANIPFFWWGGAPLSMDHWGGGSSAGAEANLDSNNM